MVTKKVNRQSIESPRIPKISEIYMWQWMILEGILVSELVRWRGIPKIKHYILQSKESQYSPFKTTSAATFIEKISVFLSLYTAAGTTSRTNP